MRLLYALLLVAVLVLAGCVGQSGPQAPSQGPSQSPTPPAAGAEGAQASTPPSSSAPSEGAASSSGGNLQEQVQEVGALLMQGKTVVCTYSQRVQKNGQVTGEYIYNVYVNYNNGVRRMAVELVKAEGEFTDKGYDLPLPAVVMVEVDDANTGTQKLYWRAVGSFEDLPQNCDWVSIEGKTDVEYASPSDEDVIGEEMTTTTQVGDATVVESIKCEEYTGLKDPFAVEGSVCSLEDLFGAYGAYAG